MTREEELVQKIAKLEEDAKYYLVMIDALATTLGTAARAVVSLHAKLAARK